MKRENIAHLVGGVAFGFLLGFGAFHVISNRPRELAGGEGGGIPSPAGPMAATQVGPGGEAPAGGAPMVQEVNELKRALEADPRNVPALVRLGNLYQDIGQFGPAVGFYEKALAITPKDPNLLTDAGTCYLELQDAEKAMAYFDRAHENDPDHWQSLFNKAVVLGRLARFPEAEAVLREVERAQPNLPEVARLRSAMAKAQARAPRPAGS